MNYIYIYIYIYIIFSSTRYFTSRKMNKNIKNMFISNTLKSFERFEFKEIFVSNPNITCTKKHKKKSGPTVYQIMLAVNR